ncbi:GNAT family N-acetyltransferase [Sphingomonas sp.]|uniref:GNAT family N-acetyltransferase n=1 Tax=Sphingomonas sp. TaxID=28214 RepID=UPI002DD61F25|nr:GNAT family N-acetyltransferase [Sphingomonas sp.]
MTKPMPLADFARLPPACAAQTVEGLATAIDAVAERAAPSHRFLRHGWYAAAIRAYGGDARTIIVSSGGDPWLALPFTGIGPGALGLVQVPGCYWPFRGFPVREAAPGRLFATALDELARIARGLRIGPVPDGDPAAESLLAAARAAGWAVLDRHIADSWILDFAAIRAGGQWPRPSTLKKNRYFEKQLAQEGALVWRSVTGAGWDDALIATLAGIERASWIASRTDGRDAKFTDDGHGRFWRAAAEDPVVAGMMRASLLTVGDTPAAFAFDIDAGPTRYAVANSYDPRFAQQSPGRLLAYRTLPEAAGHGIERVDWGAGDSGYKQTLGATPGPALRDWLLLRPGLPALAGRLLRGAWARSGNPA